MVSNFKKCMNQLLKYSCSWLGTQSWDVYWLGSKLVHWSAHNGMMPDKNKLKSKEI